MECRIGKRQKQKQNLNERQSGVRRLIKPTSKFRFNTFTYASSLFLIT